MTDKDTLMNLIDEYAEVRHINGCWVYNTKTAAARQAVIEALSGVQALSAAPARDDRAREDEDLQRRCVECVEWQQTGELRDGALRAYAKKHWPWHHDSLQMAERATETQAMRAVASWGTQSVPPAEQPIGELVVTKTKDGQIVSVTRQDDEGRILSVIATSDPAEQQAAPKAAPVETYQDSTPHLSVGDSSFEGWYESYCPAHKSDKQRARDAYAAGMGDPLVVAAPKQEVQEPSHRETVDVVGVRSNGEHVNLEKITMPPRMKAREIAIEQFGSFKDDDGSDAEMCFGAIEYFLEWLIQQGWSKAPQPAPAPLIARSLAEWHEDDGCVAWWAWNGREWAGEPAWIGNPNCEDWPGYHTHWTPHPDQPVFSALAAQGGQ